jgi:hypothetical protein
MEMEKGHTPDGGDNNIASLHERLQQISVIGQQLAIDHSQQTDDLLAILRTLEELHRHVREDYFQHSLPRNRHGLYALLQDMEANGGWPYIERMRLQALLQDMEDMQSEEVLPTDPYDP